MTSVLFLVFPSYSKKCTDPIKVKSLQKKFLNYPKPSNNGKATAFHGEVIADKNIAQKEKNNNKPYKSNFGTLFFKKKGSKKNRFK